MNAKRDRTSLVGVTVAALCLSVTAAAWGHGFSRGGFGPGREGAPHGDRAGGLLERLIFPCRGGCFDTARTCVASVQSDAVTCATGTCDATIQAARTACATDRTAQPCQDARTALLACIQPCRDTARSAFGTCQTALEACVGACDTAQ